MMKPMAPIPWTTTDLMEALAPAHLPDGYRELSVTGISTDSRTIEKEALFLALRGEHFDGHDFVTALLGSGVRAFVVDRRYWDGLRHQDRALFSRHDALVIVVEACLPALGCLARFQRIRSGAKVIAVTGSNGKTTTREMISVILSGNGNTLSTTGNLNNEIGLPLTLLRLSRAHQWAVVELGMNHEGEMERLGRIALPDVAVITNTDRAHLEGLGSVETVAKAKAELLTTMTPGSTAILNRDDPRHPILAETAQSRNLEIRWFSLESPETADLHARAVATTTDHLQFELVSTHRFPEANTRIRLASPARFMVSNALAASGAALAAGAGMEQIRKGLQTFRPVSGRMEITHPGREITLINDSYNANPGSMAAALALVKSRPDTAPALAILGDMLELGDAAAKCHRDIGALVCDAGVDRLYAVGPMAGHVVNGAVQAGMPPDHALAVSRQAILSSLEAHLQTGTWILVKGSRGMRMEQIVTAIETLLGQEA